jgi:hypothetical protein
MSLTHREYEALSPAEKLKFVTNATPEELAAVVKASPEERTPEEREVETPIFAPEVETPKKIAPLITPNQSKVGTDWTEKKPRRPFFSRGLGTSIMSIVFLLIGAGMVIDGLLAASAESQLAQSSAIRGIENVTEYGLGFVIAALAFILNGIAILIDNNSKSSK